MQLLIFDLDVPTLVQVLIAGNLLSAMLVFAYYYGSQHGKRWKNSGNVALAKLFQALGFILISQRGAIGGILSANLGNSFLLIGFYFEALAMMCLIGETRGTLRGLRYVAIASVVGFNVVDMINNGSSTRVVSASVLTIAIFLFPCLKLLLSPDSSGFKRLMGACYSVFLALLVPRTILAFMQPDTGVLSNTPIQSLTFLAMTQLMVFSMAAYLLLMKEGEDTTLTTLATTDYLTGLPNRRHFFEVAERLFSRYQFEGNPIGVLFLDIDHFKAINDYRGHAFGDKVLEELAAVIRENIRPCDVACRYGGEEFVVLLPEADTAGALRAAERIRAAVAEIAIDGAPDFHFTVSVGVSAEVPQPGESLDVFINHADQAMYKAKKLGRDQAACHCS